MLASIIRGSTRTIVQPRLLTTALTARSYSSPIKRLSEDAEIPQPHVLSSVELVKRHINYSKPADVKPLLEAPELYATIHIYDRKFLVTEGDKVLIPTEFKDLQVGDEINLSEVSTIGSRDHTLTGNPRIDPSVFCIKGVVIEKTRTKREITEKTKRRRRHVRHVVSKNSVTAIRISELSVNQ